MDSHAQRQGAGTDRVAGNREATPMVFWSVRKDDGRQGKASLTPHPPRSSLPPSVPSTSGLPSHPLSFLPSRPHQTIAPHGPHSLWPSGRYTSFQINLGAFPVRLPWTRKTKGRRGRSPRIEKRGEKGRAAERKPNKPYF